MTTSQRHTMFFALSVATMLVVLNIFIVASGSADGYYAGIKEWIDAALFKATK